MTKAELIAALAEYTDDTELRIAGDTDDGTGDIVDVAISCGGADFHIAYVMEDTVTQTVLLVFNPNEPQPAMSLAETIHPDLDDE